MSAPTIQKEVPATRVGIFKAPPFGDAIPIAAFSRRSCAANFKAAFFIIYLLWTGGKHFSIVNRRNRYD
jgi:hypothetical protein